MWGFRVSDLNKTTTSSCYDRNWRREWDSNPRYSFPHTRFPSVRLKPLGHLSGRPSLETARSFLQAVAAGGRRNSANMLNNNRIFRHTDLNGPAKGERHEYHTKNGDRGGHLPRRDRLRWISLR